MNLRQLRSLCGSLTLLVVGERLQFASSTSIDTQKSAEIIFFAASNIKTLNADLDFANHMARAQGPTPPQIDPPAASAARPHPPKARLRSPPGLLNPKTPKWPRPTS